MAPNVVQALVIRMGLKRTDAADEDALDARAVRRVRDALDEVLAYDAVSTPALQRVLELAERQDDLEAARAPIRAFVRRAFYDNQPRVVDPNMLIVLEQPKAKTA